MALLSPATLVKRHLTHLAETDAKAAWQYERDVRAFHVELRQFYYPLLFNDVKYDEAALATRPTFNPKRNAEN